MIQLLGKVNPTLPFKALISDKCGFLLPTKRLCYSSVTPFQLWTVVPNKLLNMVLLPYTV